MIEEGHDTNGAFRWLGKARLLEETIEYSTKGPLYAASAVFTARERHIQGTIRASLVLGAKWEREFESHTDGATFIRYEERDRRSPYRALWERDHSGLHLSTDSQSKQLMLTDEQMRQMPAPILSAAGLFFALEFPWRSGPDCAAYVAAGRKIYAFRIGENAGRLMGRLLEARDAWSTEEFAGLAWEKARTFELTGSEEHHLPSTIRVAVPPFGSIEARLIRHG